MSNFLQQQILRMIAATGPLSIAEYMHLCHSHRDHGYYAAGNPVGAGGDFITAPEISQMFGEMIGVWAIGVWHQLGKPDPFQIAELGPGRGTLMKDFIRAAKADKGFLSVINVKLVETSPSLKTEQIKTLKDTPLNIEWVQTVEELESVPTLFIGNEFLDAIAFRQFVKTGGRWRELCIGSDENNELLFTPGTTGIDESLLPEGHEKEPEGAIYETAPAREAITSAIANHVASHSGAALFIDYGHETSGFGDTFQAVQSHKPISPLADPGNCDLTSHVDFEAIGNAAKAEGVRVFELKTQGEFLLELGVAERAGELGQGKPLDVQTQIRADVERLVLPDQMGELFKVLCMTNRAGDLPPFGK